MLNVEALLLRGKSIVPRLSVLAVAITYGTVAAQALILAPSSQTRGLVQMRQHENSGYRHSDVRRIHEQARQPVSVERRSARDVAGLHRRRRGKAPHPHG